MGSGPLPPTDASREFCESCFIMNRQRNLFLEWDLYLYLKCLYTKLLIRWKFHFVFQEGKKIKKIKAYLPLRSLSGKPGSGTHLEGTGFDIIRISNRFVASDPRECCANIFKGLQASLEHGQNWTGLMQIPVTSEYWIQDIKEAFACSNLFLEWSFSLSVPEIIICKIDLNIIFPCWGSAEYQNDSKIQILV